MKTLFSMVIAAVMLALTAGSAVADSWLIERARGVIEIQQGSTWRPVARGDLVADGTLIRTGKQSQARLKRGAEWLDLSAMTMIVIHDKDGRRFTTVLQMAGTVEVEAEVQNVQHFAVETPYLAAVVKGTHFVVSVKRGASSVSVDRGLVEVGDRHGQTFFVPKGESVTVTKAGDVKATGQVTTKTATAGSSTGANVVGATSKVVSGANAVIGGTTATVDGAVSAVAKTTSVLSGVVVGATSNNPCNGNSGNPNGKGNGNSACRSN